MELVRWGMSSFEAKHGKAVKIGSDIKNSFVEQGELEAEVDDAKNGNLSSATSRALQNHLVHSKQPKLDA
ncbi:hypothetical protein GX51_07503 [Blastomyces parvus]|uniref:Uncharacterized protein n=1 Tax=Blastomyces parvus TaxID=2060905 RepID=A0A2B7WKF3_9EURO|nr:hypothetical protein GX51_07503 [Blastomyces parvus]